MTRHELHEILKMPFERRYFEGLPTFNWEHTSKKFYQISSVLALEHFVGMRNGSPQKKDMVLKCQTENDVYYFGVELVDCDNITLEDLLKLSKHGVWSVYTWAD